MVNGLLKRQLSSTKYSDLYTPFYATELIAPYLSGKIWECACGEGHITAVLERYGMDVIETDIALGVDFLKCETIECDYIVTNPPYELKDKFIERCYNIGKPFALLLPLTALGGMKRNMLFREYGLEVLIPSRRINFIYKNAGKANWFHSAWFCHNVLPEMLMFVEMDRENEKW